jgi:hypothetical protein
LRRLAARTGDAARADRRTARGRHPTVLDGHQTVHQRWNRHADAVQTVRLWLEPIRDHARVVKAAIVPISRSIG